MLPHAFNNSHSGLYPIEDLKMHDKKLALQPHRIKIAWNEGSRPIYDQDYDWMVILGTLEYCSYNYLRIQAALLGSLHSVIGDGRDWFSGLTRGDAGLAMCRDSTAKIITYSWGVEMTHCVFWMKDFWGSLIGQDGFSTLEPVGDSCSMIIIGSV